MKKILLLGFIGAGAYYLLNKKKSVATDAGVAVHPDPMPQGAETNSYGLTRIELNDMQAAQYLANYKDLSDAYGHNLEDGKHHWYDTGFFENRTYLPM